MILPQQQRLAFMMHHVPTTHEVKGLARSEHVFHANWTVVLELFSFARMVVELGYWEAASAWIAVKCVFSPADSKQLVTTDITTCKFHTSHNGRFVSTRPGRQKDDKLRKNTWQIDICTAHSSTAPKQQLFA